MSEDVTYVEVELDPGGYSPRPDLFARNLSRNTITFNLGRVKWTLPPYPDVNFEQSLPWTVARSPGFQRLWESDQVLVSVDADFNQLVNELPTGSSLFRPYVHTQVVAQAVVTITHDLARSGPVKVVVFSLDGQTEYIDFYTEMLTEDVCRISFDDPITFVATVF